MKRALLLLILIGTQIAGTHFAMAAKKPAKSTVSKGMADACAKIVSQSAKADPRAIMAHYIGTGLDMNRLRGRLEELSGEKPMEDGFVLEERGSKEGRAIARMRIFEMLEEMGLKPQYEDFDTGSNVIAEIRGTKQPTKVIELAAHYDSVGNPGADDNGSGVALLLELALYMQSYKPEITIRFIFNDLEETGHHGAIHHTKVVLDDKKNEVLGAIVIDTIGWAQRGGKYYLAVIEVGEKEDQATDEAYAKQEVFAAEMFYQMNRIGNRDGLFFSPETKEALPGTADHGPYWDAGIPAVLIAAPYEPGFINPGYHKQSDTVDGINWDYYKLVASSITEMLAYQSRAHVNIDSKVLPGWTALEDPNYELNLAILTDSLDRDPALPPRPKPTSIFSWPKFNSDPGPKAVTPPVKVEKKEDTVILLPPPEKKPKASPVVETEEAAEPVIETRPPPIAVEKPAVTPKPEPEPKKRLGFFESIWKSLTGS